MQPGPYAAEVAVLSREHPGVSVVERVAVEVLPFVEIEAALTPSTLRGSRSAKARLGVLNRGNVPTDLALRGEDPESALTFRISPSRLRLRAGETANANVAVRARKDNRTGADLARPMRVVMTARDGSAHSGYGTFVQEVRRRRRWWRRLLILIFLVGLLAGVAYTVMSLYRSGALSLPGVVFPPVQAPAPAVPVAPNLTPAPAAPVAPNQPPVVVITEPPQDADGVGPAQFGDGGWFTPMWLRVDVRDPEDGDRPDVSITWTTDRTDLQPALLGQGWETQVQLHSPSCEGGVTHTITVTVTDSGGAVTTAVRRIGLQSLC